MLSAIRKQAREITSSQTTLIGAETGSLGIAVPVLTSLFNTLRIERGTEFERKYLSSGPRALSERNLPQPQPWLMQMVCLLYCTRSLFTRNPLCYGEGS